MDNETKDRIEYLHKSPVFASSLGSKELFHSNIWAYLIEQNEGFLSVFFDIVKYYPDKKIITIDGKPESIIKVHREKLNMDLIIETETKVFVIENKIKSLPRRDQLDKYPQKVMKDKDLGTKKKDGHYYLLTGVRKDEPSIIKGSAWKYRSYSQISNKLDEVLEACQNENYYSYVKEYSKMIVVLSEVLNSGVDVVRRKFYFPQFIKEGIYPDKDLLKEIDNLRLGDIFQKLNADCLVQKFEEMIDDELAKHVRRNSGYTHQHSLAEFYYERTRDPETKKDITKYVRIGVQIQDAQFRWYIETRTKERKNAQKIYEDGKGWDWFASWEITDGTKRDNNQIQCPTMEKKKTSLMKNEGFDVFRTTNNSFVYQYYNIDLKEDPKACDFNELASRVIKFLIVAKDKIDDIEKEYL